MKKHDLMEIDPRPSMMLQIKPNLKYRELFWKTEVCCNTLFCEVASPTLTTYALIGVCVRVVSFFLPVALR